MNAPPDAPGHDPGQAVPGGLAWEDLVEWLVGVHGSLAAVAERLAEERGHTEDLGSIERALRRLRGRAQRDGGVWGRRVLATFGLPPDVEARVRWMGVYHSRFNELPRALAAELVHPWDRPPVHQAPARAWLRLAHASLALRGRDFPAAEEHLAQAARAASAVGAAAIVEQRLAAAFVASRRAPDAVPGLLADAAAALDELLTSSPASYADDLPCWRARLVDQQAWALNVGAGRSRDHDAAWAMYAALPDGGVPPFARCRRANGLAWSAWKLGRRDEAVAQARASVAIAGDAGSLRLRAMALNALATFLADTPGGEAARARAARIAEQLEDEELGWRTRAR